MLQQIELRLAAVTGAQADRMTRDEGWRLLAIGRQVERLVTLAGSLQVMFETQQALSEQGFELMLQLADCVITYRSRHQRWQHPVALVELLVRDHANRARWPAWWHAAAGARAAAAPHGEGAAVALCADDAVAVDRGC